VALLEAAARDTGRPVTDEEAARISRAVGHSTIPEALAEVLFSICGAPEPITCRFCSAEIEQQDTGLWEACGDTADERRHCTYGPAHLHEPGLPGGTGKPTGTCNCQKASQSPLNPRTCGNCGYQLNDDQLALVRMGESRPAGPGRGAQGKARTI
jgi:hypothetical protein